MEKGGTGGTTELGFNNPTHNCLYIQYIYLVCAFFCSHEKWRHASQIPAIGCQGNFSLKFTTWQKGKKRRQISNYAIRYTLNKGIVKQRLRSKIASAARNLIISDPENRTDDLCLLFCTHPFCMMENVGLLCPPWLYSIYRTRSTLSRINKFSQKMHTLRVVRSFPCLQLEHAIFLHGLNTIPSPTTPLIPPPPPTPLLKVLTSPPLFSLRMICHFSVLLHAEKFASYQRNFWILHAQPSWLELGS